MTDFTTDTGRSSARIPSAVLRVASKIWSDVQELRARRTNATALHSLKERDLKDVGLTKDDIAAATRQPLSIDAATRLHLTALDRSGNW